MLVSNQSRIAKWELCLPKAHYYAGKERQWGTGRIWIKSSEMSATSNKMGMSYESTVELVAIRTSAIV